MLSTSPGPSKSVGCGGIVAKVDTGLAGGGGSVAGFSTSTSVKGYCPGLAAAARRISTPVGPLDGKLAQPVSTMAVVNTQRAPRNEPLRRGTQSVGIN